MFESARAVGVEGADATGKWALASWTILTALLDRTLDLLPDPDPDSDQVHISGVIFPMPAGCWAMPA